MSLAQLRPVLYAGCCRIELPALDRAPTRHDAVAFLAHYRSAELDVRIRPAGIGSAPISARVSMLKIERYFARCEEGAILEIPDVEDLHVVMFTAYYSHQELEVSIRRARVPNRGDSVRVSLEGLPEFFLWCNRATQIYCDGGKMCGFDAEQLTVPCGVKSPSDGSFDDAMQAAFRWLLSLISAIGDIDYFDAWLAAMQLRVALDRAERLAGLGLMSCESRLFASRRLNDIQSIATPMLALAPAPSRHEIRHMRTSDGHRDRRTREDMEQQWGRSVQQQLYDVMFKENNNGKPGDSGENHDDHISNQVQFPSSLRGATP